MRLTTRSNSGLDYIAEVSDDLQNQARILLQSIANQATGPAAGEARMRVDWGIVKLVRRGDEVIVEEPDYPRDPLKFVPGLNFTCAVLREQQRVHDRLGVSAEPVNYDQFLLVYPAGLTSGWMAATRQATAQDKEDSGWCVFDANRIDWTDKPQAKRVYEIARERPALLGILSVPVGWSVRFEGDILMEAVSPEGRRMAIGMTLHLTMADS